MQKLPEAPDKKGATHVQKGTLLAEERDLSLSAVTSGVTTLNSFLLLVEGTMCPSLDDALTNLSTSSSVSFTNDPQLKIPNNRHQNHD